MQAHDAHAGSVVIAGETMGAVQVDHLGSVHTTQAVPVRSGYCCNTTVRDKTEANPQYQAKEAYESVHSVPHQQHEATQPSAHNAEPAKQKRSGVCCGGRTTGVPVEQMGETMESSAEAESASHGGAQQPRVTRQIFYQGESIVVPMDITTTTSSPKHQFVGEKLSGDSLGNTSFLQTVQLMPGTTTTTVVNESKPAPSMVVTTMSGTESRVMQTMQPQLIVSAQPTIVSTQPTIVSTQPTIVSTQPTIVSTQPTIVSTQPTIVTTAVTREMAPALTEVRRAEVAQVVHSSSSQQMMPVVVHSSSSQPMMPVVVNHQPVMTAMESVGASSRTSSHSAMKTHSTMKEVVMPNARANPLCCNMGRSKTQTQSFVVEASRPSEALVSEHSSQSVTRMGYLAEMNPPAAPYGMQVTERMVMETEPVMEGSVHLVEEQQIPQTRSGAACCMFGNRTKTQTVPFVAEMEEGGPCLSSHQSCKDAEEVMIMPSTGFDQPKMVEEAHSVATRSMIIDENQSMQVSQQLRNIAVQSTNPLCCNFGSRPKTQAQTFAATSGTGEEVDVRMAEVMKSWPVRVEGPLLMTPGDVPVLVSVEDQTMMMTTATPQVDQDEPLEEAHPSYNQRVDVVPPYTTGLTQLPAATSTATITTTTHTTSPPMEMTPVADQQVSVVQTTYQPEYSSNMVHAAVMESPTASMPYTAVTDASVERPVQEVVVPTDSGAVVIAVPTEKLETEVPHPESSMMVKTVVTTTKIEEQIPKTREIVMSPMAPVVIEQRPLMSPVSPPKVLHISTVERSPMVGAPVAKQYETVQAAPVVVKETVTTSIEPQKVVTQSPAIETTVIKQYETVQAAPVVVKETVTTSIEPQKVVTQCPAIGTTVIKQYETVQTAPVVVKETVTTSIEPQKVVTREMTQKPVLSQVVIERKVLESSSVSPAATVTMVPQSIPLTYTQATHLVAEARPVVVVEADHTTSAAMVQLPGMVTMRQAPVATSGTPVAGGSPIRVIEHPDSYVVDEHYIINKQEQPTLPHPTVETVLMQPQVVARKEGERSPTKKPHKKPHHHHKEHAIVQKKAVMSVAAPAVESQHKVATTKKKASRGCCGSRAPVDGAEPIGAPEVAAASHHSMPLREAGVVSHHSVKARDEVVASHHSVQQSQAVGEQQHPPKHHHCEVVTTTTTSTMMNDGYTRQTTSEVIPQISLLPRHFMVEQDGISKVVPTIIHDVPVTMSPVEVQHNLVAFETEETVVEVVEVEERKVEKKETEKVETKKVCC